jgi:CubicO group peptidase (beta-lactamase class C family)
MTDALMDDFPPALDRLVTLSNWRKAPFSAWGFRNVRRLIPTANIAACGHATALEMSLQEIGPIGFNGHDGNPTTVSQALRATHTDAFVVLRRGHYIPELEQSVYAGCTIRHLLDMSVGIAFIEDYDDPRGDVVRYRHAAGWDPLPPGEPPIDLRSFLGQQKPDGQKHGELFHYVSTNTDVLGWVYERACDQAYADILSEYLWTPLGAAHDAYITVDARNAMRAAGGVCVTPRDLARFGEMIRRRGVADGRQVVPGTWIDDINERGDPEAWARWEFADMFPQASYRSQWYRIDRSKGVLCAFGIHGQWIYIHPEAELVIVRMASEATPLDLDRVRGWRRGFDAIAEYFS